MERNSVFPSVFFGIVDDVEVLVHDVCFNIPPRYIESQFETEIIAESG
jgi:hypothetical protein